jgi:hypothetical protein
MSYLQWLIEVARDPHGFGGGAYEQCNFGVTQYGEGFPDGAGYGRDYKTSIRDGGGYSYGYNKGQQG